MFFIPRCLLKNKSSSLQVPFSPRRFSKSDTPKTIKDVVKTNEKPVDLRGPIVFSTSEAGWKKTKIVENVPIYPWWKQTILWGTYIFFIHYFIDFRQPNDLDEELDMPLGKRLLWVKELHLIDEKNALLAKGSTTKHVDEEMEEINRLRKKYNYI